MSVLNGVIVETDHFIREVESRPGLWFTHSPDYQNREQRKKLWEDIAKKYQPKWDSYDDGQKQIRGKQPSLHNNRCCMTIRYIPYKL